MKKLVRSFIHEDDWSYISWYRDRFGILRALPSLVRALRGPGVRTAPNPFSGQTVLVRPGTADQAVYDEVFIEKEYDLDYGEPKYIIDAGAHIGLTTVFFAAKYPSAKIVAVEPESSNFAMLLKNTSSLRNVSCVNAGLWSKTTRLRILNTNSDTWGFRVSETQSAEGIPAIGVSDLMNMFDLPQIDVLKLDVEGSEKEVLTHATEWMSNVSTMIVELHDRFQPGCTEALESALSEFHYCRRTYGLNTLITNIRRPDREIP